MKNIKQMAIAALCAAANVAGAQFSEDWSAAYNGTAGGVDVAHAITTDKRGFTYIAGEAAETGTGTDMVVVKYGPSGNELWHRPILATGTGRDVPHAIAVDDHGIIYVTGESQYDPLSPFAYEFRTAKISSSGVVLENVTYRHNNNEENRAMDLAINKAGHVFITGWTNARLEPTFSRFATTRI